MGHQHSFTPRTGAARTLNRLVAGVLTLALAAGTLAACGDDQEITAEEQALLDDPRYGEETFHGADYVAEMEVTDEFSIIPFGEGGDTGRLSFVYFGEDGTEDSLSNVDVHQGSVVAFRDFRIRVVTINSSGINVRVAELTE